MDKEEIIDLFGNVLLGICAPYLFLVSDNPFKVLFKGEDNEDEQVDKVQS